MTRVKEELYNNSFAIAANFVYLNDPEVGEIMRKNTIPTERAVWRLNKPASLLVVLLGMALKEIQHLGAVW